MSIAKLTLGPLLFNWEPEKKRDFYFRMADEAPVDCVYVGEVVCGKRAPFFAAYRDEVIERLQKAGKQVVLSSLALLTTPRELSELKEDAAKGLWIEANDVAAVQALANKNSPPLAGGVRGGVGDAIDPSPAKTKHLPSQAQVFASSPARGEAYSFHPSFVVGPTINVMNEGTMDYLVEAGARRIVFASEMNGKALATLARRRKEVEKEVQVFGRQSLAVSMRCYHARANGRDKDHCRLACKADPDGLEIETLTGQKIFAVNGTQTLSYGYLLLAEEALALHKAGVTYFRLSPQDMDMVAVARLYRDFLDKQIEADSLRNGLKNLKESAFFINGFYHGKKGLALVAEGK